jgi:hypothetical protein
VPAGVNWPALVHARQQQGEFMNQPTSGADLQRRPPKTKPSVHHLALRPISAALALG